MQKLKYSTVKNLIKANHIIAKNLNNAELFFQMSKTQCKVSRDIKFKILLIRIKNIL